MTYNLKDVYQYAQMAAEALSGKGLAFEAANILNNEKKWSYYNDALRKAAEELESVPKNVISPSEKYKEKLANYAFALGLAAEFLYKKEKEQNPEHQKIIDKHCSALILFIKGSPIFENRMRFEPPVPQEQIIEEHVASLSEPKKKEKAPLFSGLFPHKPKNDKKEKEPLLQEEGTLGLARQLHQEVKKKEQRQKKHEKDVKRHIKGALKEGEKLLFGEGKEPEVLDFLESKQFKALNDYYQQTLLHDNRSHSYLCGLFSLKVEKASVLKDLIDNLTKQKTMDGIKDVLNEFYQGKGMQLKTGGETDYEILNKGQNITTRVFGHFGLKTTTIEKIDNLDKLANPEKYNSKAKMF
ncbi:Uncharacterised protein [Legionella israelensis]|uniref:Uncharacterized protein n=2 Tax=Legionella israelensis TaxID=454 RepID=A0A0W0V2D2_9GAMM|nr:hypothetical protein [Legionella israelensis]KTD14279.1 hypothetical protein Lisr_2507 [Legionella israelensis]QBS10563.1 hypothetical protein E4T55_12335 [Legionella israelensis]SCX93751.1 hypothetical protein SAMN02746069_00717 [Legionella israelensis DSM 19235]STX57504.1 Uncharacterised protein [Legionella israelensis]